MKILLLNPPAEKRYIRDYYCSKSSKTNYIFEPIDLLMLSGILSQDNDVYLCDAIVDRMKPEECLKKIVEISPDAIIWLSGIVSWPEDFRFMSLVRKKLNFISIVSGDIFLENSEDILKKNDFIDAILFDFTTDDIVKYLSHEYDNIYNIVFKLNGQVVKKEIRRAKREEFILPVPRHELFVNKRYRFPFVRHKPFATVLTDFGCPYKCLFCIIGVLGYKYRTVENVIEELKYIKKLGVREIFFADQTWGAVRNRAVEICDSMLRESLAFGWLCFTRVDCVDRELLELMKRAGCHTIIFGVESASEEILKKYHKGYTREQISKTFSLCRDIGIETVGTFIMGLPEETEETFWDTVNFAKQIKCDYYSFNVAVPRPGTELRKVVLETGLMDSAQQTMDQGGKFITMPTKTLTQKQVNKLMRKILFDFYFRPSYLFDRLKNIKSYYHLKTSIQQAFEILKTVIGAK